MKKRILLITFLVSLLWVMPAFANVKAITGLTISASHTLEAGDVLSAAEIEFEGGTEGDVIISQSSDLCEIASVKLTGSGSGKTLSVGDKITATVVLCPIDEDTHTFKGSYTKSSIKISGGTFVSSSVSNGLLTVKFTLKPISGPLNAPIKLNWNGTSSKSSSSGVVISELGPAGEKSSSSSSKSSSKTTTKKEDIGKAAWSAPTGSSGYYDVYLYRGSTIVKKFTELKATSVDFYPYMTKKGSYYFKVRTVPVTEEQKKYATRSEWAESDEYYLDEENVSDGTGSGALTDTKTIGWVKSGSTWYYRYPDGNLKKDGWEKIDGKWYLFDKEGKMLTGKQTTASGTYYMSAQGSMQTGWVKIDNAWYYFNSDAGSQAEGRMLQNTWLRPGDVTYYLTANGQMAIGWTQIGNDWYYFDQTGNMAKNTTIDTFYVNEEGVWVK